MPMHRKNKAPPAEGAQLARATLAARDAAQSKREVAAMTVADLIERLRELPATAPVYVWDGDNAMFTELDKVSEPAKQAGQATGLPKGAVVMWGS